MGFQWHFIRLMPVLWLVLHIKEFECRNPNSQGFPIKQFRSGIRPGEFNRAINHASQLMMTEFPTGISQAVDDASGVFANVLGKILSKKKFLGLESFYYK